MGMEEFNDRREMTDTEKRAKIKEMQADLDRQERTTGQSGAVPNASKQQLLDATDIVDARPNERVRWVNVGNPEKAQLRQSQGYERIPLAEGGRQVGNLALFSTSRENYERRVDEVNRVSKERLSAHKKDVEKVAEAVVRELRDRHGINVERFFIKD